MKKLLSLLLAAIMVLGIVAVPAFADATVALTVTGVGATVKPGDEFTAELRVPKFSDPVSGYALHINFEKKILEVTDVQFTGYNSKMVTNAEEANKSNPESNVGSVVSAMAEGENTVLAEDLVLTVKFKVRSDAASGTYDKLVWINEEATEFTNVDEATGIDGNITVNFGNKTFGAKVEGGNTTVIPEGAPFTAVRTDIEGAPVTVTKQNGKVSYEDNVYGGETDHWHIVIPENATKLYITYPKDSVYGYIDGYLNDAFVVAGFLRTYNITYNEVSVRFYTFKNVTDDGESVTLAIDPSEFVGEFDGVDGDGDPYKYTKGFTPEDKAFKATGHITVEYGEAYYSDEDAAKAVDDLIAAIGKVEFTDESKGKIDAARAAYDKLTDAQKKLVKKLEILTDAEAEYERLKKAAEDKAAAKAVDEAVAKLAPVTLNSGKAIEAARKAFNALTPAQKELLAPETESKLKAAEAEYARLVKDAADKAAAKEVEDKIARLQPVTKDSGKAIKDARSSYEALTPEQKELVSEEALKKLIACEKAYAILMKDERDDRRDNSSVIHITANAAAKGEQNPHTGAPAMSIAPAMLVLAAAALVLKKHK